MEFSRERSGLEKKFYDLCLEVIEAQGLKIYDLKYLPGTTELRVFIYDLETETAVIEDCIKVDQALSPAFEENSWIPDEVTLEVSSPGLYRELSSVEHFEMALGKRILCRLNKKLKELIDGQWPKKLGGSKEIICTLVSMKDQLLEIELENKKISLSINDIKKINLEPVI